MLGAHNVREDVEDGRMEIVSTDIYQHESYNGILIHNDIALIKLPEPIEFNGNTANFIHRAISKYLVFIF